MATMVERIFLVVFLCLLVIFYATAQRSFAETKFDLSPDLPAEELPSILPSIDSKPTQIHADKKLIQGGRRKKKKIRTTTPPAIPPQPPQSSAIPQSLPPSAPLPAAPGTQPTIPLYQTGVSLAPLTFPTLATLPPFTFGPPSGGSTFGPHASTIIFPPAPTQGVSRMSAIPLPLSQTPAPTNVVEGVKQEVHGPKIEVVRENQSRDKAELWFDFGYDLTKCTTDIDSIAEQFKRKFPRNLLKNGKETILADLLATRLKECVKKQSRNQWERTEALISQLDVPVSEKDECRSGLVQEEISCINVQSYACQFIERDFHFRLVPARLIVQEARLAEDGAEKCKKISKLVKKQLEKWY